MYESLNENSMIHIQNRVDIETLINSKLISSRSKNTFLDKTGIRNKDKTENKSETSILFGRKINKFKKINPKNQTSKMDKIKICLKSNKNKKSKSKGNKIIKKPNDESWNLYKPNQLKNNLKLNNKIFKNKPKKIVLCCLKN